MQRWFAWISFFILCTPALSTAEYRVFVLKISKRAADPKVPSQDFRLVESTLDPEQYRYFYPVAQDEDITYIDTWRCYGRTDGFKPHCPNPKAQIPAPEAAAP